MLTSFWRHAFGATAFRIMLASTGLGCILEARIEISTPITAAIRYREAMQLVSLGLSPYAGRVFRGPSLLLALVQTLQWGFHQLLGSGAGSVMAVSLFTALASVADVLAAASLKALAILTAYQNDAKSLVSTVRPDTVAAMYLWNPLVVVAAVGGSMGGLENCAVFAALAAACRGNAALAAVALMLAAYLGLHPILLTVPVMLLLWRGPEPLVHQPPPPQNPPMQPPLPPPSDTLAASLSQPQTTDTSNISSHESPDALAQDDQPALEQSKEQCRQSSAVSPQAEGPALEGAVIRASREARAEGAARGKQHQDTSDTPLAWKTGYSAQPITRPATLKLPEASSQGRPKLTLQAGQSSEAGEHLPFGSPVEVSRVFSPTSKTLSPALSFGSPVDLADSDPAARQLRFPDPLKPPDGTMGNAVGMPGELSVAEQDTRSSPHDARQPTCTQVGPQLVAHGSNAPASQAALNTSRRDKAPRPEHDLQPVANDMPSSSSSSSPSDSFTASRRKQLRDSFKRCFSQRRRQNGPATVGVFLAWLVGTGVVLSVLSDLALRNLPGHQCRGILRLLPWRRRLCFGSQAGGGRPHWSRHVYGTMLLVDDLTPNIGLHWYFFAEMFAVFRPFWHFVFACISAAAVVPLAIRLPHRPLLVATAQCCASTLMKPYPSVADVAQYLALLPLMWPTLEQGDFPLVPLAAVGALVAALGPPMWHMWIYLGSANANFYYAITLLFGAWQGLFLVSMVAATIRCDRLLAGKSLERW